MRRSYAAVLAAVIVTAAGCTADEKPAPATPVAESSTATPAASVSTAWRAPVKVRQGVPWLWEYSDDVVVAGPRGLVALDRESGAEVWRLPLGGPVCGTTRSPSEIGLVAVVVGRCAPTGGAPTARRTTVKGIDLESASVVWERPFIGAPSLDVGGEVLLATMECGARRIDLTTGAALGRIDAACSDSVLAGQGVVIVRTPGDAGDLRDPVGWRVVDIATGETRMAPTAPGRITAPTRVVSADPLTVLAGSARQNHPSLVRIDDQGVRLLAPLSIDSEEAFTAVDGDRLVMAAQDWTGVTVFNLEDGAIVRHVRYRDADEWIPIAIRDGALLGIDGDPEGLSSGHGRLTTTNLDDNAVDIVGDLDGGNDYAVAGPKGVVFGDILLMPTRGNNGVVAHRLTLPSDE
ncbi:MAG: hypothetical protein ABIR39_01975 [Nocardioides sp.]|uniref:outer membrane protein assembly factor BamB family protein n=1 Tax=Nocardioides sp. TaxID=35761 RepID=UPI0032649747